MLFARTPILLTVVALPVMKLDGNFPNLFFFWHFILILKMSVEELLAARDNARFRLIRSSLHKMTENTKIY